MQRAKKQMIIATFLISIMMFSLPNLTLSILSDSHTMISSGYIAHTLTPTPTPTPTQTPTPIPTSTPLPTPTPTPSPSPTPTPAPTPSPTPSSTPTPTSIAYMGLSGYPTSTSQINSILQVMEDNCLNIYRMSFNPEWMRGPHPYHQEYVQYFLDHSSYTIIVDRNHIYPPTEEGAQTARDNWNTARNSVFQVLETWPNNPRVAVELVNEYVSSDFYSRMQSLVDEIRDAGYTNPIVVDKWNQPWTVIRDPLDNVYQGYHFYFNSWSVNGAILQINTALSKGINLINTEVGASYNEGKDFTTETVKELFNFLQQCTELGVGNTVWMNENLGNWPYYENFDFEFPIST
jgi:hypothetical protein